MKRRERHSETKRAEFRALYLLTGNATKSALEIGACASTGVKWAQALAQDAEFLKERIIQRDNAFGECVARRMRVADVASDRFEGQQTGEIDTRYQYGKLILDSERNAISLARVTVHADSPPAVVNITVSGPAEVEKKED